MKFFVQRVSSAKVEVDQKTVGQIGRGYMVLIGIAQSDRKEDADKLVKKLVNLRIFEDENGKTNRSLRDVDGEMLLISQFTLYADTSHGNRPSFINAAKPDFANEMYEYIIQKARETGFGVQCGIFGADMKVSLVNEGPFSLMLQAGEAI